MNFYFGGTMAKRIVLIDDHELVREGFQQLIESEDNFQVIGSYNSAEEAMAAADYTNVDILVCDISLGGESGLQYACDMKQQHSNLMVIILSMYENPHYVLTAKSHKINGFISKRDASETLVKALNIISIGGEYFSPSVQEHTTTSDEYNEYLALTSREKEVFKYLALGQEPKKIAQELTIASKTVHVHRRNILNKFAFSNQFQLTKFALKYGLIKQDEL